MHDKRQIFAYFRDVFLFSLMFLCLVFCLIGYPKKCLDNICMYQFWTYIGPLLNFDLLR